MNERARLVAPCGIDCGICELYTCKDNPAMTEYLIAKGFSREVLPCKGCLDVEGKCPIMSSVCEIYICTQHKKVSRCYSCDEFPCAKLTPSADKAGVLPHNLKVFNSASMKRIGVEEFTQISSQIKELYYKGKMVIGSGPRIEG